MNTSLKSIIYGAQGGLIAVAAVVLVSGAIYYNSAPRGTTNQADSVRQLLEQSQQWQGEAEADRAQRFQQITKLLQSIDSSQADTNQQTTQQQIQSEVRKALADAGADKAGLTKRVKAIIREIAKQSAQDTGRAAHRPPEAASSSEPGEIGTPVSNVEPVNTKADHILGNPEASVSLIVYDDFECPFCRRHQPTLKNIVDHFDGRVNVVMRFLPLGMHNPAAKKESLIGSCVARLGGNAAFWDYADAVFEHTRGNGRGISTDQMDQILTGLDLSSESIHDCVDSNRNELLARINDHVIEAQRLGIHGTPGNVLINNTTGKAMSVNGARPMGHFVPVINTLMGDS